MSPMGFGPLLSQLFILGCDDSDRAEIRLAGGAIAGLHGRDLRDADFQTLWRRDDRPRLRSGLAEARGLAQPLLIHATSEALLGGRIDLEIVLAPLEGPAGQADRMIGLYQLLGPAPVITGRPVSQFALQSATLAPPSVPTPIEARPVLSEGPRRLRLVVDNGRRVA